MSSPLHVLIYVVHFADFYYDLLLYISLPGKVQHTLKIKIHGKSSFTILLK